MSAIRAVGRFLYDFVVGDDWKIAAGVVASMAASAVLLAVGVAGSVVAIVGTALVAATFSAALLIDVRPTRRR
jgi:hypothetical protein